VFVQKKLFWAAVGIGAAIFVAAAIPVLSHL